MKKILLGAGGPLFITAQDRLATGLGKRGISAKDYSVTKCKVYDIAKMAADYDILIRTGMLNDKIDRPVIDGIGLITGGAAADKVLDEIAALLKG
jgi:galactitol-specific phosphotransferase system IIB component